VIVFHAIAAIPLGGPLQRLSGRFVQIKGTKRVLLQPADGEADDAIAVAVRRRQRLLPG